MAKKPKANHYHHTFQEIPSMEITINDSDRIFNLKAKAYNPTDCQTAMDYLITQAKRLRK